MKPNGYVVAYLREQLRARYPDLGIEIIGAGISGNRVSDLHRRLVKDVIEKKPTIVVIYIGINDVWHWTMMGHKGNTKVEYEALIEGNCRQSPVSRSEVVLCTPSVIGERFDEPAGPDA